MPKFCEKSKSNLKTCHFDLQIIFNNVIKYFDCSIICGHRNFEDQDKAYQAGLSQLKFPNSSHNLMPSLAVDAAPYPIVWTDVNRIRYFAGFVMGVAETLRLQKIITHKLRWGGDWDRDTELKNNHFNDLVHFELVTGE
jgi:peptidoglycan L-alanyl-D-glutamate endopeptidase CwlK